MKTITLRIYNKFFNKTIVTYKFPFDKTKAMSGWYSDFWRDTKIDIANSEGCDKNWIRLKWYMKNEETDRAIAEFPSGTKMDAPFNLNKVDIKILQLHLEALKLAINNK